MPEYPEIVAYIEGLLRVARGEELQRVRIAHPFLLRTADPPIESIEGLVLEGVERIGKRVVFAFTDEYFLVLHLMISGRLHWRERGCQIRGGRGLAALDFPNGSLLVSEASSKKRASLHLVRGREALGAFDRGGLEIMDATLEVFRTALKAENHTLKRSLTDQSILSGIGNAYSDEILHRAGLSPFLLTESISEEQVERLYDATREILTEWTERLRKAVEDGFPKSMKALRKDMAVHGRYGEPCPVCGTEIQRIRYASRETNYCPRCQTGGRLLADRALSRLLNKDWPRTVEELEERRG
ncbi:MAG: DNA-formamidopyrimidine glycosylase family protein [Anaerolineae bacterium]|jgi:formamidopyrimidine-DNA glycosylase